MSNSTIHTNFDLKAYNSFGISCVATSYSEFSSQSELIQLLDTDEDVFILGGGSNLLLPDRLDRRVLRNVIGGIDILDKDENFIHIRVGAGVVWHDLVNWSVNLNYGGLENLSLIPGCVGASPIQNIGAYGVELKDVSTSVGFFDFRQGVHKSFNTLECKFGYRDSIFKHVLKGNFCITHVNFKLSISNQYQLNTSYGAINTHLLNQGNQNPSIKDVSDAVIAIRNSKLPNPKELGNSGSFFKNAIVSKEKLEEVRTKYEDVVHYPVSDNLVKIPTGWLIEKTGWKGRRVGEVGCYEKQALVLVNFGNGTSKDIQNLASSIQDDVEEKFGIRIEPEVNLIR